MIKPVGVVHVGPASLVFDGIARSTQRLPIKFLKVTLLETEINGINNTVTKNSVSYLVIGIRLDWGNVIKARGRITRCLKGMSFFPSSKKFCNAQIMASVYLTWPVRIKPTPETHPRCSF